MSTPRRQFLLDVYFYNIERRGESGIRRVIRRKSPNSQQRMDSRRSTRARKQVSYNEDAFAGLDAEDVAVIIGEKEQDKPKKKGRGKKKKDDSDDEDEVFEVDIVNVDKDDEDDLEEEGEKEDEYPVRNKRYISSNIPLIYFTDFLDDDFISKKTTKEPIKKEVTKKETKEKPAKKVNPILCFLPLTSYRPQRQKKQRKKKRRTPSPMETLAKKRKWTLTR